MIEGKILKAVTDEMTLSYTATGRVVPTTLSVVAASLADAIDFKDVETVHAAFKKARDTEAIPLQGTLKGIVATIREKQASNRKAISWHPAITKEQSDYIYAWWHLHGTRMAWLTDDKARATVEAFEADPNNREFVSYQNGWTHVAADNVMKYGTATMRTRL